MKKRHIALGAAVLTLGVMTAAGGSALAYRGDPSAQGSNYTEERHQAMQDAMANNDYQAWSELMADKGRVTEVVTEENFARFAEAHQLALAGDSEAVAQIRAELGLGQGNGAGKNGSGQGQGQGNGQRLRDGSGLGQQ